MQNNQGNQGNQEEARCLREEDLPRNIRELEYAVRGAVVQRMMEMKIQMAKDPKSYPFDKIVPAHIGNPQAVGHIPPTFSRQVIALIVNPALIENPPADYPADAIARAKYYLNGSPGVGAYSHSQGSEVFRREVAKWFEHRDGFPCDFNSIWLLDGASMGIKMMLEFLLGGESDGILIPCPQYPLYSATITKLRGKSVAYRLDAENDWALNVEELQKCATEARAQGIRLRALVVINPGNPTGAVLTKDNLLKLVKFAEKEGVVLFADEVYQDNVYEDDLVFTSLRKVVKESGAKVQLASFHSASKGYYGECGFRGGITQVENFDPAVVRQLYKLSSANLCGNLVGQAMMALICNPPKEGDLSFDRFLKEKTSILSSLKRKSQLMEAALRNMKNVTTQRIKGAMYGFPRVHIPPKGVAKAKELGVSADTYYCIRMLEETGLATVPGRGFSMPEGQYYYRVTILPKEEDLPRILKAVDEFNTNFMNEFA